MYIGVCGDFNVAVAEVLLDGVDIYTTPAQCRATGMPQFMWGQARNLRGEGIHEFCKGSGETVWIPRLSNRVGEDVRAMPGNGRKYLKTLIGERQYTM